MKRYVLGIELGSTRIKSVLVDADATVLAQGAYEWKSEWKDGYWTYELSEVHKGLSASFADLARDYREKFGTALHDLDAIGISGMMHGYLAFDREDRLLVPFRTWQNTNTERAAEALCEAFSFNVPQRWSVSHFYQAVLDGEAHVAKVAHLTTLSGYVHYLLTGRRVLGVCDASGMFPIENKTYDRRMLEIFDRMLHERGVECSFSDLLPEVLVAGDCAGRLSEEGARLLDPSGNLRPGCLLCPPEGDGGTGMMATNSVRVRSANVSAGTSAFLMAVMEKELRHAYREIDVVTTPMGDPVAMIHVNNFTSELNAWVSLFEEVVALGGEGKKPSRAQLFDRLFAVSDEADPTLGGLLGYNFLAGEPVVKVNPGVPMLMRSPDGSLTLANFMRMQIWSALGSLAMGMEILRREDVCLDSVFGHGGFFKAGRVSANAMSAAVGAPITVMQNAGEGGAWGVALLALMTARGEHDGAAFLDRVFQNAQKTTFVADEQEKAAFASFLSRYRSGLEVERCAAAWSVGSHPGG